MRAGRHLALQITPRAGEIDAAELQDIVAPDVVEFACAERIVLFVAMLWRDVEALLQRVRSAGIGIGDDEARLVEAGVTADTEHRAMIAHDAARQLQMGKALPCGGIRRGKHVRKRLADHAEHRRHLCHVGNPFRPQAVAGEQHQRGQAVQHPGQALPLHVRIDHHEAEMGDLLLFAVEFD